MRDQDADPGDVPEPADLQLHAGLPDHRAVLETASPGTHSRTAPAQSIAAGAVLNWRRARRLSFAPDAQRVDQRGDYGPDALLIQAPDQPAQAALVNRHEVRAVHPSGAVQVGFARREWDEEGVRSG